MGEVYRARDTKLGRDVAVKVLPQSVSADPERLARFEREARALASLNHPNIVTVYSVEESGEVRLLAMELVEGSTLDLAIPAGGLPLSRFSEIAIPLADALSAAHERGIVHRDLKPANVMLTREGRLKVLDFGLAKLVAAGSDPNVTDLPTESRAGLTGEGAVFGTVAYMSPEQARGGNVDARSDVFSLGIVLYEMLTGERPFQGASSVDVISAILRDQPSNVTEVRSDLPPDVGRILRRCLAKDPRDRYQTSRDVFNELRELQREATVAAGAAPTASMPTGTTGARADVPWIAVMPFKTQGSDPELSGFVDGLGEDITAGLSRFPHLNVISRNSATQYAGRSLDIRAVGHELGARYALDGAVRRAGNAVRVSVQLLDAATGTHLWAEAYDRYLDGAGIFKIQDDITDRVVATIADPYGVLVRSMAAAVRDRPVAELSAKELVLRVWSYWHQIRPDEHARMRTALERKLEHEPEQEELWACLSHLYSVEHGFRMNPLPDPVERALGAARRAVDIDPTCQMGWEALAEATYFSRDLGAFRNAAERAMTLNPRNTSTVALMGVLISHGGEWERGCEIVRRAMALNPHHPGWYQFPLFFDQYRKGEFDRALETTKRLNMPEDFWVHAVTAAASGRLGRKEDARIALRTLRNLLPGYRDELGPTLGRWIVDTALVEQVMAGIAEAEALVGEPPPAPRSDASSRFGEISPKPSGTDRPALSIAVLPFSDMSAARDQEYLCEGMAEEIMNALVRVDGLRVASRTSAFRARREGHDLPEIARLLSVGHVLEGSVRSSGARLRVTAQLTDIASGFQLWSERFDRDAADIFAVQDEIAAGVVAAVEARLAPGTHLVPARPQPANLESYRSYLKGRHLRGKEHLDGALRAFEEAVRLDPSHAPSWTALAEATVLASVFGMIPAREACAKAKEALATAKELQGESADGLHVEAFVAWIERRWAAMESAWRRAIDLQPANVLALASFGLVLCTRQRLDEALPFLERARQADPLASFPYALTGSGLLGCGRPQEALRYLEDALSFENDDATALDNAGMAKVALGRFDEGIATLERVVALSQRGAHFLGTLGWALATAGRKAEARTILDELRSRRKGSPSVVSETWLLGALGEIDAAFEVVARAEEEQMAYLYFTGLPGFDPIRRDPRFGALLARLGLRAE